MNFYKIMNVKQNSDINISYFNQFSSIMGEKKTIGLVEEVIIEGTNKVYAKAMIDTGATRSSVDLAIAKKAGLGPIVGSVAVKKAQSNEMQKRIKIAGKLVLDKKEFNVNFNIADRSKMSTPVLIGRDVIFSNFVVDIEKTHNSNKISDLRARRE